MRITILPLLLLPIVTIGLQSTQLPEIQTTHGTNRASLTEVVRVADVDRTPADIGLNAEPATVKVHPNPSSLNLYVTLNGGGKLGRVIVYDILGNIIVKSETFKLNDGSNTWSHNVSNWHVGTYVVRVLQDNSVVKSLRFIKN